MKFDMVAGHHLGYLAFEIGARSCVHLSLYLSVNILVGGLKLEDASAD